MSTASLITRAKDFNVEDITYGTPKTNTHGGKSVPILVNGQKLVMQFPLNFTYGGQTNVDDKTGRASYSLNLVLEDGTPLRTALAALEKKVLADSVTNSKSWYGRQINSPDVIAALFYPLVRHPKNKESGEPDLDRTPSMKAKLAEWEGVIKTELYAMDQSAIHNARSLVLSVDEVLAAIPMGSHLTGLLQCDGVWYAGGRCGVTWRLLQAKVKPPVRIQGFCMVDDSDEEDAADAIDEAALGAATEEAADATGEAEQAEEAEEPAAPAATKKKRAVKKRAPAAGAN